MSASICSMAYCGKLASNASSPACERNTWDHMELLLPCDWRRLEMVILTDSCQVLFAQILPEMLQHLPDRIHRRLAQAADRGVAHHHAQIVEQRLVPARPVHQHDRLFG